MINNNNNNDNDNNNNNNNNNNTNACTGTHLLSYHAVRHKPPKLIQIGFETPMILFLLIIHVILYSPLSK